MAFELPDHLPRGGLPQDKATQVLTKIGKTTHATLNASLAASWLDELDSSIQATRIRISKRIHDDLPAFERQLRSSKAIQTRLSELSATVDALADSLNDPNTGILATLLRTLTAHESLSVRTLDSETITNASEHLLHIRRHLHELSEQVERGQLPESSQTCLRLQKLIKDAPEPLNRADIMTAIRKRYRTLSDRLQEQLSDAYARSVRFSSSDDTTTTTLSILSSTIVPPTSTVISLSAILQSLTPDSLSASLSTLRRDVMTKFVDVALLSLHPISVTASDSSSTLSLSLSATTSTPLQSLRTLMTFLDSQFFRFLPPAQASFPGSLHTPITSAVLVSLLAPSIPSSLSGLAPFLDTVDEAVRFEDSLSSGSSRDRPIQNWVNDVASQYEKKRRENFLRQVKDVSTGPDVLDVESPGEGEMSQESSSKEEDSFAGWGWGEEEEEEADKEEKEQETYSASPRAKKVMDIVRDVIQEGEELMNSNVFAKYASTKNTVPGQLLMASVPIMLDLHRALYPIAHADTLLRDADSAIRWSNDCKFLSVEATKLCERHGPASAEKWIETAERLMTVGELCYEEAVV